MNSIHPSCVSVIENTYSVVRRPFLALVLTVVAGAFCSTVGFAQVPGKSLSEFYPKQSFDQPYVVFATIKIKPEHVESFVRDTLPLIKASRAEDGALLYQFHQGVEDPTVFSWYEHFKNEAAFKTHIESKPVAEWVPIAEKIVDVPLKATPYRMVEVANPPVKVSVSTPPGEPTLGKRVTGVQHFGVTVSDISRAREFYVEVLGGTEVMRDGDFQGEVIQNTLMQGDELKAKRLGVDPASLGVPNLKSGDQRLDVVFVQFDNVVIELLQYRDGKQPAWTNGTFAKPHEATSPAIPTNMHISFEVDPEVDFDKFIKDLETEAHKRGMTNVRFNRTINVASEQERADAPLASYTNKISEGTSNGWALAYGKGPEGEQLEFNQVKPPVKALFDASKAKRAQD